MSKLIQVTTTTSNKEDAEKLSDILVSKKLVACVQVLGPLVSTYWWQGKIEKTREWLCLIKSKKLFYKKIEECIKRNHPYDVPEIIMMPIVGGSKAYLQWIEDIVTKNKTVHR